MKARELFNQMVIVLNHRDNSEQALALRGRLCLSGVDLYSPENLNHLALLLEANPDCAKETAEQVVGKDKLRVMLLHYVVEYMRGKIAQHVIELPPAYENFLNRLIALNKAALTAKECKPILVCAVSGASYLFGGYGYVTFIDTSIPLSGYLILVGALQTCPLNLKEALKDEFFNIGHQLLANKGSSIFQPAGVNFVSRVVDALMPVQRKVANL